MTCTIIFIFNIKLSKAHLKKPLLKFIRAQQQKTVQLQKKYDEISRHSAERCTEKQLLFKTNCVQRKLNAGQDKSS